jgi:hypothetical protein
MQKPIQSRAFQRRAARGRVDHPRNAHQAWTPHGRLAFARNCRGYSGGHRADRRRIRRALVPIFPARWERDRPLTPAALARALWYIRIALSIPSLTSHDLRRIPAVMASERLKMNRSPRRQDAIERQAALTVVNCVRRRMCCLERLTRSRLEPSPPSAECRRARVGHAAP